MIVLDTDHITELQEPHSARGARLSKRLDGAGAMPVATTIISYEEQMRGWLAAINKVPPGERQVSYYDSLAEFVAFSKFPFRRDESVPRAGRRSRIAPSARS